MIRFTALPLAAALAGFSLSAAAALPTESFKFLPADLAVEAAQAAIAHCKSQGYNITVTIVDRVGATKVVIVGDGAGGVSRESTYRKAYTAAKQRQSTQDFTKRITSGGFNPTQYDSTLATGPGGLPIKVGEATIGGIAAAGAPGGDKDEACAAAGLEKIKDRLN